MMWEETGRVRRFFEKIAYAYKMAIIIGPLLSVLVLPVSLFIEWNWYRNSVQSVGTVVSIHDSEQRDSGNYPEIDNTNYVVETPDKAIWSDATTTGTITMHADAFEVGENIDIRIGQNRTLKPDALIHCFEISFIVVIFIVCSIFFYLLGKGIEMLLRLTRRKSAA